MANQILFQKAEGLADLPSKSYRPNTGTRPVGALRGIMIAANPVIDSGVSQYLGTVAITGLNHRQG
jgi:hypothetical protein